MSSTGETKRTLVSAAKTLWGMGGVRAYYRGLAIGLVGVFPYSAIDMSTFEALKLAYLRSTGKDEPGVLALLAFGSLSGSVGATSVYPLNLVRTRLQASGSSGHPERYAGPMDVVYKTYARDGWRGFYRGLFPTLAKVVPAVSISYVVYEQSKKKYIYLYLVYLVHILTFVFAGSVYHNSISRTWSADLADSTAPYIARVALPVYLQSNLPSFMFS